MRKFWVKNAKGQIFDMNREDAFFSSPKGLGISRKVTYQQLGYSWAEKQNILSQKKPYGNMVFDGYEQYDEFLDIIQHTPLVLMYQPLDTTYYLDVNTFTLDKSEISYKDTFLTCKVTFEGKTPWYVTRTVNRGENEAEGKVYNYRYPYTYKDSATGEAVLNNGSSLEAYCRLVFYGPIINPAWQLSQAGKQVAAGRMLSELSADTCLVINSDPLSYEIAEYDMLGQKIKDRYEESDFNTQRFIMLPPGNSTLRVSHEGASKIRFYVEVTEFAG